MEERLARVESDLHELKDRFEAARDMVLAIKSSQRWIIMTVGGAGTIAGVIIDHVFGVLKH